MLSIQIQEKFYVPICLFDNHVQTTLKLNEYFLIETGKDYDVKEISFKLQWYIVRLNGSRKHKWKEALSPDAPLLDEVMTTQNFLVP